MLDAQLKKTASKRKHYEEIHMDDIMRRVEQEPVIEEERKRQVAMKEELEKKYTYLLSKDGKANTKVVQLIKRL